MMIKESQILIPAAFCIPMQTRGAAACCFSFFWVQVDVIGIPPAAFYFTWWALGPMYCTNGRRRGIPPGEQRSSFICRLPSCLLQIFRKVSRFWHESKNHFCRVSSSPFEIAHHSSKAAALAAPEWGGQSRGHKSRLNVVSKTPWALQTMLSL